VLLLLLMTSCVQAAPESEVRASDRPPPPATVRGPADRAVDLSKLPIETRRVYEPLSKRVQTLRGYPARDVLRATLGEVPTSGLVLVKCRDGYHASIPAEKFRDSDDLGALFAFAVEGRDAFTVTSAASGNDVELSPFYVVWSSTTAVSNSAFAYRAFALAHREALPPVLTDVPESVAPGAAAFAKRCASCHALGDYGGKFGPQLLEPIPISSWVDDRYLRRWVLEPESMRAGTNMPGLPEDLPDREATADAIVAYLRWLDGQPR
jgi:cytochrome c2